MTGILLTAGARNFFSLLLCPPSLLSNGYWGLFPWGVKWMGHEADSSPPLPHMSSWKSG